MMLNLVALMERQQAIFGTGTSDSAGTTAVSTADLFNNSSNSWSASGNIAGTARSRGATFSFIDSGFFVGGSTSVGNVDKWSWGTSLWTATTALTTPVRTQFGFNGSSGKGVDIGGRTASAQATASEKFSKAAETWSAGGSLGTGLSRGMSSSSNTIGYCFQGMSVDGTQSFVVATCSKYTYSSDGVAAGTSLTTALSQGAMGCLASPTKGLTYHGKNSGSTDVATRELYTFSGDTVSGNSSLNSADNYVCAASFNHSTVLMGGTNSLTATNIYNHAADTTSTSTATSTGRTRSPGISSSPPFV